MDKNNNQQVRNIFFDPDDPVGNQTICMKLLGFSKRYKQALKSTWVYFLVPNPSKESQLDWIVDGCILENHLISVWVKFVACWLSSVSLSSGQVRDFLKTFRGLSGEQMMRLLFDWLNPIDSNLKATAVNPPVVIICLFPLYQSFSHSNSLEIFY